MHRLSRNISKKLGHGKHHQHHHHHHSKATHHEDSTYGDVVMFGAKGVGKTSIANRLVHNYFTEQYIETASDIRYNVDAMLEIVEDEEEEEKKEEPQKRERKKSNMILKKSFQKSVLGRHRPKVQRPKASTMKRFVSINGRHGEHRSIGQAYISGVERGLKRLTFSLIDTPSDVSEMHPLTYNAFLRNAAGFFLVCSFDDPQSLEYIENIYKEIRENTDEAPIVIIANKSDIDINDRHLDIDTLEDRAEELGSKLCCASMCTEDGYVDMAQLLLNEINISAERVEYEESLPEDFAYIHEEEY